MKPHHTIKHISEPVWECLLQSLEEIQPSRIIPYLNNEPLLDKRIFERIEAAKRIVPQCTMELSTNGSLLTDNTIEKLLSSPLDDILISVFGHDNESQQFIMGEGQPYDKLVQAVQKLHRLGAHKNIAVVKVVDSPYLKEQNVQDNKKFWQDLGIKVLEYGYLNRSKNTGTETQRDEMINPKGCGLNRHKERIYVHHDGLVSFCCHDWHKKHIMGDLKKNSLLEIWQSDHYAELRAMVDGKLPADTAFLCRRCKLCQM